jgi:outer membrane protein TolC
MWCSCKADSDQPEKRPRQPGLRACVAGFAGVTALSISGCLNLREPFPESVKVVAQASEPATSGNAAISRGPAPASLPGRSGSSNVAPTALTSNAPGGKNGDPAVDASVARTLAAQEALGSRVPPIGPLPDINAASIPAYGGEFPIDLSAALRLAERVNPVIGAARARIDEALGNQLKACVELVPWLNAGASYNGHNGVIQQSNGKLFNLSRQTLYFGGGASAVAPGTVAIPAVQIVEPLADAIFDPLAARQRVDQARFDAAATSNTVLLEVAKYYLDLLEASAWLEAQRRSAQEAADLVRIMDLYVQSGEGRPYDGDRCRTEWRIRRADVRRAEEQKAVASARLCRRLHLDPSIQINPPDRELVPVALIDLNSDLPSLLQVALRQRPEIGAAAANIGATEAEWKKAIARPLLPSLFLGASGGAFGGGSNLSPPLLGRIAGRSDFDAGAYWTLMNMGFGNLAQQKERWALVGAASAQQARVINMVRDEVASAYGDARAQREQIEITRVELETAMEGFRRDFEQILGAVKSGQLRAPRPVEVVNSLTLLARARRNLIRAIIAYDQSQFRLFVALGSPPPLEQPADPKSAPVPISSLSAEVAPSRPNQPLEDRSPPLGIPPPRPFPNPAPGLPQGP